MQISDVLYGFYFDKDGLHQQIEHSSELEVTKPHWLHFDYTSLSTVEWLKQHSGLNSTVINALLDEETRPRATALGDGILISLRGVNLAAGSNPEDMVSIRLWVTKNNVISTRRRKLLSTQDIANDFNLGNGPSSAPKFVIDLTEKLISRMSDTINEIEEKVADIEENIITSTNYSLRNELSILRRQIISLRRYLSPQKDAMLQLLSEKITLFSTEEKIQLRETLDHLVRYIEDLDSIKDRAAVSQEELSNRLAEQMNNRMYVLSIVAAIFLPLGFLTGLLGINVGGIPGAENNNSFVIFTLLLVGVVAIQIWIFKKKKWF
ncbi:zinc transporter ZntB [Vibrio algarum]|uniref:Zinc transporter ZntB n=1 Tax=Vibrio algarum TaxID=3020714 RepID=A0ABT4YUE1_9VIBR|nr:zinc transporter ZntB [Vibrio sp. KJ40-1]MDB1125199.1 zinc transporter ZntB [Vibrio sp. KJ40-1]